MLAFTRVALKTTQNVILTSKNRLNKQFFFKNYSKKDIEADAGPIKYSQSPASKWRAEVSRSGIEEERLWYEKYVLIASISVFMIYFCVLREENDVDEELQRTLYSRIEGLEEHQLKASLKFNQQHGLETESIIRRLQELKDEKN